MRFLYGWASRAGLVLLLLLAWEPTTTAAQPDHCLACHAQLSEPRLAEPAEQFRTDVHAGKGFGCVSCHGGDATNPGMEAMDPAKGYIGKPEARQIPGLCGSCHSDARFMKRYNPSLRVDQEAEYFTSQHGRRLKLYQDAQVATCVSCHSAHGIRPPSDPRSKVHPPRVADTCGSCHSDAQLMSPYKIPTDQAARYRTSIHWATLSTKGDLSAPACNDCHGNHGAAPPGVDWVGNVCGQCHAVMADLFSKSFHSQLFTLMGSPGCATCHGNHEVKAAGDEMVGVGQGSVCGTCHSSGDKGGQVAIDIKGLLDSLKAEYKEAESILSKAARAGMEVSQAQFDLNSAQTSLIKARAAVHTFRVEAVKEEVEKGLSISKRAYNRGTQALEELQFRRFGLAVSVLIILGLIAGVVLKIRQLERKN